jgi:DNA-binding response OmpR family regulator
VGEKIMVVDDEKPIREILRNLFQKDGYEVILASNGKEAIRLAESEKPHLIMLDARMPELDGIATCAVLRASETTRAIPIMVATAFGDVFEGAVNAGVDDFVTKPFDLPEILVRVKALLKVCHIEDEMERAMAYMQERNKPPSPGQ